MWNAPWNTRWKTTKSVARCWSMPVDFRGCAYTRSLRMIRQNWKELSDLYDWWNYSVFQVKDRWCADCWKAILDRFENKQEIKGAVYRPGIYQFGGTLNTVRQLVEKTERPYGWYLYRTCGVASRARESEERFIQVDIKAIMDGTAPDVPLQRNDVLYIPSIHGVLGGYLEEASRLADDGIGFYRPCGCFPPYQGQGGSLEKFPPWDHHTRFLWRRFLW